MSQIIEINKTEVENEIFKVGEGNQYDFYISYTQELHREIFRDFTIEILENPNEVSEDCLGLMLAELFGHKNILDELYGEEVVLENELKVRFRGTGYDSAGDEDELYTFNFKVTPNF